MIIEKYTVTNPIPAGQESRSIEGTHNILINTGRTIQLMIPPY